MVENLAVSEDPLPIKVVRISESPSPKPINVSLGSIVNIENDHPASQPINVSPIILYKKSLNNQTNKSTNRP